MIKIFLVTSALLGMFALQNNAYAAKWVKFAQSDEYVFEVDQDRISTKNNITQVWVKFTVYNDLSSDGLTVGDYMLYLDYIKCKDNMLRTDKGMVYAKDGIILESFSNDNPEFEKVVAHTIGEDMFNAICHNKYPTESDSNKYSGLKELEDVYDENSIKP